MAVPHHAEQNRVRRSSEALAHRPALLMSVNGSSRTGALRRLAEGFSTPAKSVNLALPGERSARAGRVFVRSTNQTAQERCGLSEANVAGLENKQYEISAVTQQRSAKQGLIITVHHSTGGFANAIEHKTAIEVGAWVSVKTRSIEMRG